MNIDNVFDYVDNSLDVAIFGTSDNSQVIKDNTFRIQDDNHANRFLKWHLDNDEKINANKQKAQEAIKTYTELVNNWLKNVNTEYENKNMFIEKALDDYMYPKFKENKSKKTTLKLLYGNISYNKPKDKPVYTDESAILDFLEKKNLNDLITVKKSINKTKFKGAGKVDKDNNIVIDGEVVPGFSYEEQAPELVLPTGKKITSNDLNENIKLFESSFNEATPEYEDDIPF